MLASIVLDHATNSDPMLVPPSPSRMRQIAIRFDAFQNATNSDQSCLLPRGGQMDETPSAQVGVHLKFLKMHPYRVSQSERRLRVLFVFPELCSSTSWAGWLGVLWGPLESFGVLWGQLGSFGVL